MSVLATVQLHTLRCIRESDRAGTEHSEPYFWPFLASFASNPGTFDTNPRAAILAESRRIRKNEMRAGQSVALDFPGNVVTATFADGQTAHQLILIVALLEADDLPLRAVTAGFQAFLDELRLRLGHNILALQSATEDERDQIIQEIQAQVQAKVFDAIKGALTTGEKLQVKLGFLNVDDFLGASSRLFSGLAPADFTLRFVGTSGDPRVTFSPGHQPSVTVFPIEFEIDGRLTVSNVVVDPCQANVDAVNAAEARIRGLHSMVQSLQHQLQTATPQQKPAIIASIRKINEQDLPAAEQALAGAERMLRRCRILGVTHEPVGGGILTPANG